MAVTHTLMLMRLSKKNNSEKKPRAYAICCGVYGNMEHSKICRMHLSIKKIHFTIIFITFIYYIVMEATLWEPSQPSHLIPNAGLETRGVVHACFLKGQLCS